MLCAASREGPSPSAACGASPSRASERPPSSLPGRAERQVRICCRLQARFFFFSSQQKAHLLSVRTWPVKIVVHVREQLRPLAPGQGLELFEADVLLSGLQADVDGRTPGVRQSGCRSSIDRSSGEGLRGGSRKVVLSQRYASTLESERHVTWLRIQHITDSSKTPDMRCSMRTWGKSALSSWRAPAPAASARRQRALRGRFRVLSSLRAPSSAAAPPPRTTRASC